MPQSQLHGFIIEKRNTPKGFGLPAESNNTDIHDITLSDENISVKTLGGNCIYWEILKGSFHTNYPEKK